MFDKFGEFDSFSEINELAENLLNEGDIESLKVVAKENGIQADFVDLYTHGEIPELCDKLTAALGKIDVEAAELKPKEIMEDWVEYLFSSPIGESTFSTLPLEPLCLSGFRSCFAGQNLKIVFLFLFLMLAPLFPLFYAVRRKILFTAGKTLFFPFPYHIIFLDISCICIHAVQLQGLRPLHVYAVHTL